MKKIISVLLSIIIIVSCFSAYSLAVSADNTVAINSLKEVTFDETNISDYKLVANAMEIAAGKGYNGTNALRIKANNAAYSEHITLDYIGAFGTASEVNDTIYSVHTTAGKRYRISWQYKFEDTGNTKPTYFQFYYVYGKTQKERKSVLIENAASKYKTEGGNTWIYCSADITADENTGILSFYFNLGQTITVGAYVDNIKIEELPAGIKENTDLSYCEKQYNLFTSVNEPITVTPGEEYTFGADISGNAGDKVFLSADGINPLGAYAGAALPNAEQSARYGCKFIAPAGGKVYVVAVNKSGTLVLNDVCLFKSKSISTNIEMGKAQKPAEYTPQQTIDNLPQSLSTDVAVTVKNNSQPINTNFKGINGIYHLFNGLSDKFGRVYTEEQTKAEFDRLQRMGVTMVRSYYGSGLTWVPATATTEGYFNFESADFKRFVNNCKELEKRGIEVAIAPAWSIESLIKSNVNMTDAPVNISTDKAYGIYVDGDYNATMKNFYSFVKQSVEAFRDNGVTNIKYMFAFTESSNTYIHIDGWG